MLFSDRKGDTLHYLGICDTFTHYLHGLPFLIALTINPCCCFLVANLWANVTSTPFVCMHLMQFLFSIKHVPGKNWLVQIPFLRHQFSHRSMKQQPSWLWPLAVSLPHMKTWSIEIMAHQKEDEKCTAIYTKFNIKSVSWLDGQKCYLSYYQ